MDRSRVAPLSALAGLPDDELDAVARVASEREFEAGDTLVTEGDFGYSLFLVEEGSADVLAHGEKVADVGPGDIVGEIAVRAGRRTASVVATSPVRAIVIFKRDVWGLERDAPGAALRLLKAMDEHVAPDAEQLPG